MGFVFPLFLLAALALLIPVVVHLVNLRRYKRELFPNVRFLKRLQVSSKKAAELRKRWLLLTRILFLLALVVAFAHPFWKENKNNQLQLSDVSVIYVDNSYSMSAEKDETPLLSLAKNQALQLINASPSGTRFVVLTNCNLHYSAPVDKRVAVQEINKISFCSEAMGIGELKNRLSVSTSFNKNKVVPVYIFSDFQAATLSPEPSMADTLKGIDFYLFPFRAKSLENVFIDSIALPYSELTGNNSDKLLARLGRLNGEKEMSTNLRLWINGQLRMVKPVTFSKGTTSLTDTMPITIHRDEWTKAELTIEDAPVRFDDTFRFVAKKPTGFSALVLARGGKVNPYLTAAFNSMPDVQPRVIDPDNIFAEKINSFGLIIVQNGEDCNNRVDSALRIALATGGNVLLFPGQASQQNAANRFLSGLADIHFDALDTARAQVVQLQQNHPLLAGIFESVPEQVQLPVANRHFPIASVLSANQQDVMSFADGKPLLASFNFDAGSLYICSAPLGGESSNFPLSYFFAPILYKMTVPMGTIQQYATSIADDKPLWISNNYRKGNHSVWYLSGNGEEVAPPQKTGGRGLAVYVGRSVNQSGFYKLKPEGNHQDSIWVAVNNNKLESLLAPAAKTEIEKAFAPQKVFWLNEQKMQQGKWLHSADSFPLWKLAIIVALLCLLIETALMIIPGLKLKNRS